MKYPKVTAMPTPGLKTRHTCVTETPDESHCVCPRPAVGRRALCPDAHRSAAERRGASRQARHAPRPHRRAEGPGAGGARGRARQDPGRARAGQGVRHEARLGADEGAPPADSAGDPAETHAGAIRGAAEEVPDAAGVAPRDDARAFRPRRTAGRRHTASVTELTRPRTCTRRCRRSSRARQRVQLVFSLLAGEVAPLLVPGAEHDPLGRRAVDAYLVHAGAVRVPVDHAPHPRRAEGRGHRAFVHVHDVGDRARDVAGAAGARLAAQGLANAERQSKEATLPVGATHRATELLVRVIVGAERIAVGEQHWLPIELGDDRIAEQPAAAALAEALSQQEITVAVQREAGDAALGKRAQAQAHPLLVGILIVIAHPGLEQVAEDVERLGLPGLAGEKVEELLRGLRRGGIEMHVRHEETRHGGYLGERMVSCRGGVTWVTSGAAAVAPGARISIFSITIGFRGASALKGPEEPVATSPILSITSIPCRMRPNTAYPQRVGTGSRSGLSTRFT